MRVCENVCVSLCVSTYTDMHVSVSVNAHTCVQLEGAGICIAI